MPVPLAPPPRVTHAAPETAVHEQGVSMCRDAAPPLAGNVAWAGVIRKVQFAPSCAMVNFWFATVTIPVRDCALELAATV